MIWRAFIHFINFWLGFWRANWRFGLLILQPNLTVCEKVFTVDFKLESDLQRYLVATLISYTPGSVAVGMEPDLLHVHLLAASEAELAEIEEEIVDFIMGFLE